jgi:hypothetical protein
LKKLITLFLAVGLILTASCSGKTEEITAGQSFVPTPESTPEPTPGATLAPAKTNDNITHIAPYSDVRKVPFAKLETPKEGGFDPLDIKTFWFNAGTVFPGSEEIASEIYENGKNPGLGVRALHERGITGRGVKVAIIDQNLARPYHSEYRDRIIEYFDVGTDQPAESGSMHGPAVASLLVGQSCGTAPDAELYYAAAPSWTGDSAFYAEALRRIIEINQALPKGEKIRVVSVSAAPSGEGSPFSKNLSEWDEAVEEAQSEGILVLDCRNDNETGIVAPGYYEPDSPEDVSLFTTGFPQQPFGDKIDHAIFVPVSYRTTAEQYSSSCESYQYTGQGGLSWGIPYAAGVLALGWQTDPTLDNDEILALLFETAYTDKNGNKIIDPPAFIAKIEAQL